MKKLEEVCLTDIVPENILADEKIYSLSIALEPQLQKISSDIAKVLHLPRLEELPHEVLNELAWAYHCDFFEPEQMTPETKRKLIATSLLQHFKKGTKYAVETLLNTISKNAEISEWFEYGGKPYYFKLKLHRLPDLGDDGETIMRMIEAAKNERSWLDEFDFDLTRIPPDQVLHLAQVLLYLGDIVYEIRNRIEAKHRLQVVQTQIYSGENNYNSEVITLRHAQSIRFSYIKIQYGTIKYSSEIEVEEELWYRLWLKWLRERWRKWRPAEIIWEFEEDEEEFEPETEDQDFLKLWLNFHRSDETRLIKMALPRENLSGAEINAVSVDNVFLSRRGYPSDRIIRATYLKRTVTKVL